ncbi:MAG: tRNA (guanosine(37)-N1)-methyltransferase TrmD [Planctomycetes bacterium]|jgi:tRNA (guanine37-N1)-methyltransferase|nr:tRNA (guanosine(37)-N1)-methyltransferase TrmD [Planctomycetota bacterium]
MRIDVLTLFPEMFEGVLGSSILKRAAMPDEAGERAAVASYHVHDIRAFTSDKHGKVDAAPFGGGPGMVLQCQPVWDAVQAAAAQAPDTPATRIVMTPTGRALTQRLVERLAQRRRLLLIAGHYEGFDQRVLDRLHEQPAPPDAEADEDGLIELSLGDYVLSGGELPAMVLIDAVVRLLPGALGHEASAHHDSFSPGTQRLLDCPHYTRPREWDGRPAPQVLLGGDHAKIAAWRAEQSRALTAARRPDLLSGGGAKGEALLVTLRDATSADAEAIAALHRASFPTDCEANLVAELEAGGHAMFSIVAEHAGRVVGHVLLSEMTHVEEPGRRGALGLGPIAVEPALRGRGIGGALVKEAIRQSRSARVRVVFVLGDPGWYGRLGFAPASSRGWTSDDPEAGDAFAAFSLVENPLPPGRVRYAPPFAALGAEAGGQQDR